MQRKRPTPRRTASDQPAYGHSPAHLEPTSDEGQKPADIQESRASSSLSRPSPRALRIGEWRVDTDLDQISKDGSIVKLEPRMMRLLALLAEHPGEVVSVEQLLESVWKEVVVTHNSVYHAVAGLRRVLGDDPKNPTYIANVVRRGYRLMAPVGIWVESCPTDAALVRISVPPRQRISIRRPWWALPLGLVIVILLAIALTYACLRPTRKPMLVVLPFVNLTGDSEREYFSDGMTEELISQLGSLDPDHLGVIARTSAMAYKGSSKDAAKIAHELGVDYLFEGSIRESKERLRVTAQLIATADQTSVWAQSFDRDPSDALKLQGEVASIIADKVRLKLPPPVATRLVRSANINAQAHEQFLAGLEYQNQRTRQGVEQAIDAFTNAISLQADYADAYAQLARTYSIAAVIGIGPPAVTMAQALDAATKALQIDDSTATAHTTLGVIHAHLDYDWAAAEHEFRRGIELNPSDANAHLFYSNSLLSPLGRHDEAVTEINIAFRLDPLSAPVDSFAGLTYAWARRYPEAIARVQEAMRRHPNFPLNHVRLARVYYYMGRIGDAIAEETRARVISGQDPHGALHVEDELRAALSAGSRGFWQKRLVLTQTVADQITFASPEADSSSYSYAVLYARLDNSDKAIASLEQAYAEHQFPMTEIGVEPAFDSLRSDARFRNLLHRVGLSP